MKRLFACILIAAMMLSLAGCGASEQVLNAIDDSKYEKASEIYQERVKGDAEKEQAVWQGLLDRIQQNYDDYNNGKKSLEEAVLLLETIQKAGILDPITLTAAVYELDELRESKEAYEEGKALQAEGKYLEARGCYLCVIEQDVNYESAATEAQNCYNSYVQTILGEAKDLTDKESFEEAYQLLSKHLASFPEEASFQKALETLLKDWEAAIRTSAQTFATEGDYKKAYEALLAGQEALPDGSVLDEDLTALIAQWKKQVLLEADEAFGLNKDYEAAIKVLQQSGLPLEYLEEEIAFYQSYKPFPLTDLEYTKKGRYIQVGAKGNDAKDVNGKTFEGKNVICPTGGSLNTEVSQSEEDAYICYNLNQQYTTLTGTLFRPYSSLSCTTTWETATTIKIYGDGVLLYEGPPFTQDTYDNVPFTVDVTGVRELRIVMRGIWSEGTGWVGMYSRHPKVCMGDLIIRK